MILDMLEICNGGIEVIREILTLTPFTQIPLMRPVHQPSEPWTSIHLNCSSISDPRRFNAPVTSSSICSGGISGWSKYFSSRSVLTFASSISLAIVPPRVSMPIVLSRIVIDHIGFEIRDLECNWLRREGALMRERLLR